MELSEAQAVMALAMRPNRANAATVGEYFQRLMQAVWEEGDSFRGYAAFGAAGFQFEVYDALRDGGMIAEDAQSDEGHAVVANALSAIASFTRGT